MRSSTNPTSNGEPCGHLEDHARRVHVKAIDDATLDMHYYNSAGTMVSGALYETYGNGFSGVDTGDYTLLSWNWINQRGGGVARSVVRDGATFRICTDVPIITLASVDSGGNRNGWVSAVYGRIHTGGDSTIRGNNGYQYGWIVQAHARGDGHAVAHLSGHLKLTGSY